ncbi:MAG: flippase-like domain-containing protein [Anaerolineae bacterium]|nr:flippase-like domain-containing protein [Anaerolineae bacterium]
MRNAWTRSAVRVLLSLLGFGLFAVVLWLGGAQAWQRLALADPLWMGLSFACTALLMWVSALRWKLITEAIAGPDARSARAYYHYLMMGKTVGLVLPEALGVYGVGPLAMKMDGGSSFTMALGTLFVDKLFDLGLSGILLLPTAAYALRLIDLNACAALFGLVFVALAVALSGWYGSLVALALGVRDAAAARLSRLAWANRVLDGRAAQALLAIDRERLPARRSALQAYGITVIRYLLMTLRFASVAISLQVAVPPLLLFVGIPIAQLGLLLAVTPGALGTLEAGWFGVLLLAGLPRQEIMTFLIGQRAALFVFVFVLGLISYTSSLIFPFRREHV